MYSEVVVVVVVADDDDDDDHGPSTHPQNVPRTHFLEMNDSKLSSIRPRRGVREATRLFGTSFGNFDRDNTQYQPSRNSATSDG